MNLFPKAMRFIIDAIDFRIKAYQERLDAEAVGEDEASDITNDTLYLESLRQELTKALAISATRV